MKPLILVVGSSNTDMVVKTSCLPGPGQTVLGGEFFMNAGGKGANQAVAAARLNGAVNFVTRLGNDLFGEQALGLLKEESIDTRYITIDPAQPSGVALITVDAKGENCIVVAPGANAALGPDDILSAGQAIRETEIILVQLEIPLATVEKLVELAAAAHKRVILNPAPPRVLPESLLRQVSVLTPNEKEAEWMSGIPVTDHVTALQSAKALSDRGIGTVIITLGNRGALVWNEGICTIIPAPAVVAVDSTAAGDVFNGALAVALAEGKSMIESVTFANHAAALSVTKLGAQSSAPTRRDVDLFMDRDKIKDKMQG
jgi:ribokinase